jgi:signal transduction histidine kinase
MEYAVIMSSLVTKRVVRTRNPCFSASARSPGRNWAIDLMEVQEEERRRISQELHDDLGQRLTLLTIKIHQLEQKNLPADVAEGLKAIKDLIGDIDIDIHRICYELYPVVLEKLGLLVALRSLCQEFSESSKIETVFDYENVPKHLPRNAALCLYRVTQEALHNIYKHARTKKASVSLRGTTEGLEAVIMDFGEGFDPLSICKRKGLGLITIEERVLSVGGHSSIRSSPGLGTEVRVVIVHQNCLAAVAS